MKRRNLFIWFLILFLTIAVFIVPSPVSEFSSQLIRKISKPISRPLISFGYKTKDFFLMIFQIGSLRSENQKLTNDLVVSLVNNSKMLELEKENQNLKTQLEYKNAHPEMKLTSANVIGLDPTNYYGTLMIDKGSDDGVSVGQAVISLGVLVGKIDQVSNNSSRVLLVTSKDSIIQVMLQESRTTGVLIGGISGIKLENIPLDTVISPSEKVITSGLGGKLPKGLLVGVVGNEISTKSDIFKTVEVKSPTTFSRLEILFVVTGG